MDTTFNKDVYADGVATSSLANTGFRVLADFNGDVRLCRYPAVLQAEGLRPRFGTANKQEQGLPAAGRPICHLTLPDLGRLSSASPSAFRAAGYTALRHSVYFETSTTKLDLTTLVVLHFQADVGHGVVLW